VYSEPPLELRVEVYVEGGLSPTLAEQIGSILTKRWPVEWDVDVPSSVSFDHPAEWHAVVPYPEGTTPEKLHHELATEFLALDPGHPLHFRTRWDFPQEPNHQEIFEQHWKPQGR
jgi:hypothetical protein